MADDTPTPRSFWGVMVSSTFTDLRDHRAALIKAIECQGLKAHVMENDSAKPAGDVLDSSLNMVREAAAYVGVISHKYGQVPDCPTRNADGLSLTELEFHEARRMNRPVLLFIMGPDHTVRPADVERDPEKIRKLDAFRETAKRASPDSSVHRVYKEFNDLREFELAATHAVAGLARHLDDHPPARPTSVPVPAQVPQAAPSDPIPRPPAFYAEPPYIGSHRFLGRRAQLDTLDDWAAPANAHPVLLFEAIGGTGKSILTWHWVNEHAPQLRGDWAGRFWYSFYEKGAVMADFCRRALAYMAGRPLEDFRKQKTPELAEQLLHRLQDQPWLLILDGLERVLVSYHRYDAAQMADEDAGTADPIAHRDPCAAIRPEDDDLLRRLAAAAPSKLLVTTRLTPRVLLNAAGQPIPGVLRERLPGLRPADAEALLRACGVSGDGPAMQRYLQEHCDCHPLVTGVLAGLITQDYLPDRGNFDAWAKDPYGGDRLNLADLDLVQKRNHILHFALAALSEKSHELLATLALLSEAVDYKTLYLRGLWRLDREEWELAVESLHESVRLIRETGQNDSETETWLALAKFRLGQLPDPRHEAGQLTALKNPAHRPLVELWLALGDREQAVHHALAAYRRAWADGEPYVYRFELDRARALLDTLGEPVPDLPPYDPAKDPKLPWEDEVAAAIEKLKAEKATP